MLHKVRYRGSPTSVAVFDALLRDEGLRVEHRAIGDREGVQPDIADVVIYVDVPDGDAALGPSSVAVITSMIESAITKLRIAVPRAQAQIVATKDREAQTAPAS